MKKGSTIYDCTLIHLNQINAISGTITVIENSKKYIPFEVNRVFYIYDIPSGKSRGAHAHIECHQFILPLTGAFEVFLEDGTTKRTVSLNQPNVGLHIPPGIWASEQNFSSASICLVLASHEYDEKDYIRDFDDFLKHKII